MIFFTFYLDTKKNTHNDELTELIGDGHNEYGKLVDIDTSLQNFLTSNTTPDKEQLTFWEGHLNKAINTMDKMEAIVSTDQSLDESKRNLKGIINSTKIKLDLLFNKRNAGK